MAIPIRLKEEPREWRRFTLQVCGLMALFSGLMVWRGTLDLARWPWVLAPLAAIGIAAWLRPDWFRGFYRFGMKSSAWLGEHVGQVVLFAVFFLLLLPLGWILRIFGYDPLVLRRPPSTRSYWQKAPGRRDLTKMF